MHLSKIRHLRRPVVHFRIDIRRVVAAPWRAHVRIPDSLEICRYTWRSRAADEQVATELEIQTLQLGIVGSVRVSAESFVGGQTWTGIRSQVKCDPVVE